MLRKMRLILHNPKIVPGLALALGVGDEGRYQLQDVLLRVNVAERVIVHRLVEVDGIQHPDLVRLVDDLSVFVLHRLAVLAQLGRAALEHFAALHQDSALRERSVKIENGKVTNNFQFRNLLFLHHHASVASSYPPECPCSSC